MIRDISNYFRLKVGGKPGRYKVHIHVGEQVNDMSLMGTMRFEISQADRSIAHPVN